SLLVLDLARNDLSGALPSSFGNFISMISIQNETKPVLGEEVTYYTESIVVDAKGLQLYFTTVLLLVTSIDLSGNNLSGDIPEELTKLSWPPLPYSEEYRRAVNYDPSIYGGNPQLCGPLLSEKCPGDAVSEIPVETSQEEDEDEYGII
ncbi:hypothetical protein GW17_00052087, partial [Ensete ventricosum]